MNMGPALRDAVHFDEPDAFRPDRWLRTASNDRLRNVHPFLLLPFGHGTRMCAGRRFAEQDLRVALARLVQQYRIEYSGPAMRQKFANLLIPANVGTVTFVPHE